MKDIIMIMTSAQETTLIFGIGFILITILFAYVAIREYGMYLDDNYKARSSLKDFIKQEQFYLYLWLVFIVMVMGILFICIH